MNIILHSPLVSVPTLADEGYTTVFDKKEARVYDATKMTIVASKPPILKVKRCEESQLLKMPLYPQNVADTAPITKDE